MSYLLESTTPNQMWQQRDFMGGKDDQVQPKEEPRHQATQKRILQNYDHVDQSPVCIKAFFNDQVESCRKRSCSAELVPKKWAAKCGRIGETHDKLVTERPSSKLRQDQMIGKKERHNKVCTSKGPRDRRVRLSAHTAIKFYDIQDRLGYKQPSKAIDWLLEKAKEAIEGLAHELPCQNRDSVDSNIDYERQMNQIPREQSLYHPQCSSYEVEIQQRVNETNMDNEVIFSMASQFQDCPTQLNLTQCLQSYEDPYGLQIQHSNPVGFAEQVLNSASNLSPDSNSTDPIRLQSLTAFDSVPSSLQRPLIIHRENQFLSQRGTLQSSDLLSLLASTNPPIRDHGHAHHSQSPNSNLLPTKEFSSGGFVGI